MMVRLLAVLLLALLIAAALPGDDAAAHHRDWHRGGPRTPTPTLATRPASSATPTATATRTPTLGPTATRTPTQTPTLGANLLPTDPPPCPGVEPLGELTCVEVQAWWTPALGHLHVTAPLPLGREVSGSWTVPLRVVLHDNPQLIDVLQLVARVDSADNQRTLASTAVDWRCEGTCAFSKSLTVDTAAWGDGWKSIYLWAGGPTPDSSDMRTSSRLPVRFENGVSNPGDVAAHGPDGCDYTSGLGRGWYGPPLETYADARVLCVPVGQAVRGVWSLQLVGGYSVAVDHLTVTLSKGHAVPAAGPFAAQSERAGRVLWDRDGSHETPFTLDVDTATLAPGWHSLAIRTRHPQASDGNRLEGVLKYWFWVAR